MKPKYNKPPLTLEEQADKMLSRNLQGISKSELVRYLNVVNYYRLRGYTYPYQKNETEECSFVDNILWQTIWDDYQLDKKLRSVIFDAIGTIEIALRSQIEYHLSVEQNDSRWYEQQCLFYNKSNWENDLKELHANWSKSKEIFKKHYTEKYDGSLNPPSWMIFETTTFGNLSKFYQNISNVVSAKFTISQFFGFTKSATPIFESWLQHLTYVRNICAHHGRLYSHNFTISPKIPKQWHEQIKNPLRIYTSVCIIAFLLNKIDSAADFNTQINDVFARFRVQQYPTMGIPINWNIQYLNQISINPFC